MRILLVTERFPPMRGGVAVSAGRLVAALAPHLEALGVVSLSDHPPGMVHSQSILPPLPSPLRGETPDGVTLYQVGRAAQEDETLLVLEQVLRSLVARQGYSLVHGFYAVPTGYVAAMAARQAGVPVLVSLRGNDLDRSRYRRGHLPWLERTLQLADRLTCVSREQQTRLKVLWGREDGNFIPNSVNPEDFYPVSAPAHAGRTVLVCGEMRFKKGLSLVQALLEEWDGRADRRLVLLGGLRQEELAAFQEWCRQQPRATGCLEVVPYRRDLAELRAAYAAADLVVQPSLWEGMPNVVLEAMACRRPVLATRVGGVGDLLEHGRTGWLLDLEEASRLGEMIEEILALPEEVRAGVAEAAYQKVCQHYRPEQEAARFLEVYAGMLASSATRPARAPSKRSRK